MEFEIRNHPNYLDMVRVGQMFWPSRQLDDGLLDIPGVLGSAYALEVSDTRAFYNAMLQGALPDGQIAANVRQLADRVQEALWAAYAFELYTIGEGQILLDFAQLQHVSLASAAGTQMVQGDDAHLKRTLHLDPRLSTCASHLELTDLVGTGAATNGGVLKVPLDGLTARAGTTFLCASAAVILFDMLRTYKNSFHLSDNLARSIVNGSALTT